MRYKVYLYADDNYGRPHATDYGYWTGKYYYYEGYPYPITEQKINPVKLYSSLARAIRSAMLCFNRCVDVTGFKIENEEGNVEYEYRRNISISENKRTNTGNNVEDIPAAEQSLSTANGCGCCQGDAAVYWKDAENNAFVDSEGKMMVTVNRADMSFAVLYCPMCGRKF